MLRLGWRALAMAMFVLCPTVSTGSSTKAIALAPGMAAAQLVSGRLSRMSSVPCRLSRPSFSPTLRIQSQRSPVVVCAEGQASQQTIQNKSAVANKSPDLGKATPKLDSGGGGFPPGKDDGGGGGGGGGGGWGRFAWGFGFWGVLLLVAFMKDKDERRSSLRYR